MLNHVFSRLLLCSSLTLLPLVLPAAESASMTPKAALEKLVSGNKRYTQDKLAHPNRDQERRESLTAKQNPFATIVGCSDSRVSPEIVFDQGIGDLFVVRVAGNVVGPLEEDSIDFSLDVLGASLIIVVGHENCGAVNAVLTGNTQDILAVAKQIEPALAKVKNLPGNALENAIKANVQAVVNQIKKAPVVARLISEKKVEVVGGYYHLASGEVELCCDQPEK